MSLCQVSAIKRIVTVCSVLQFECNSFSHLLAAVKVYWSLHNCRLFRILSFETVGCFLHFTAYYSLTPFRHGALISIPFSFHSHSRGRLSPNLSTPAQKNPRPAQLDRRGQVCYLLSYRHLRTSCCEVKLERKRSEEFFWGSKVIFKASNNSGRPDLKYLPIHTFCLPYY